MISTMPKSDWEQAHRGGEAELHVHQPVAIDPGVDDVSHPHGGARQEQQNLLAPGVENEPERESSAGR